MLHYHRVKQTRIFWGWRSIGFFRFYQMNQGSEEGVQYLRTEEHMEILLDDHSATPPDKRTHASNRKSNQAIFGNQFRVDSMEDPQSYLPRYQNRVDEQSTSLNQDCLTCCGSTCLLCIYPFALCCCKCSCVYELETSKAGFIEEFGMFKRMLTPGFNLINPCSEEVVEVDLKIKLVNIPQHQFITQDNVKVAVKSSVAYRIINPIVAQYKLGQNKIFEALAESTAAGLRNAIGEHLLQDVLTNRSKIVDEAKKIVSDGLPAGLEIDRIFLEDIIIPKETLNDLSSAAKQRRISEATIINSKADTESASLLKEVSELLDTKAAMQIRYLEMVQEVGKKGVILMMPVGVDKKGYKN